MAGVRWHRGRGAAALVACLLMCGSSARAQDAALKHSYLAAKLLVSAGGDIEIAGEATTRDDALQPGFGGAAQYMARPHKHFALGGTLGLTSWQSTHGSDTDRDRNLLIDAAVVPAGVLPIGATLELYAAPALAVSMSALGDQAVALDVSRPEFREDPTRVRELDQAIGLAFLPVLGVRIALTRDVGLLAELGCALRWYEHDLIVWDEDEPELVRRIPLDVALAQLTFAAGVFF